MIFLISRIEIFTILYPNMYLDVSFFLNPQNLRATKKGIYFLNLLHLEYQMSSTIKEKMHITFI